jgi:hypothetical protein
MRGFSQEEGMANAFDDVRAAVSAAEFQLDAADSVAQNMAILLVGRLRLASKDHRGTAALKKLKRELRDFDMTTGNWKERGQ